MKNRRRIVKQNRKKTAEFAAALSSSLLPLNAGQYRTVDYHTRVRRRARTRDDGTRHSRSRSIGCTHDGRNDGRMNETDPPSDYTALITPRSALSRPGRVISGWMVGKGRRGGKERCCSASFSEGISGGELG